MAQYKKYEKKEVAKIPFPSNVKLSVFQEAGRESWIGKKKNVMLQAKAGSGKSFTVAAMAHLDPDESEGLYTSFMTSIVTEMDPKLPEHIKAVGCHALGSRGIAAHFKCKPNPNVGKFKINNMIRELNYFNAKDRDESRERIENATDLISKMKITLTEPEDLETIQMLMAMYDISFDCFDRFFKDIPDLFKRNDELAKQGIVDFDDMLYIPVKYDIAVPQYKRVFADECQDFSPLMQRLISKFVHPDGKIMMVGDTNQSIMGFAGADTSSMAHMKDFFSAEELPLSVCYRCHRLAIEEAQKIVPDILPHENAIMGELVQYDAGADKFEWSNIKRNSMILCRRNAPLIKPAFKLLKEGVKATIKGQNFAGGLIKLIDTVDKDDSNVNVFLDKLAEWKDAKIREIMGRKYVNMGAVESTEDKADALESLAEGCQDTMEIKFKINRIFKDSTDGVILSTAHRSKGLEHDNVYILDHHNIEMKRENMSAEAKQQERNLHYVAVTRPKKFLGLIP